MQNIKWYYNRLKAMNILEIIWRFNQKLLKNKEYKLYYSLHDTVYNMPLSDELNKLKLDTKKIPFNIKNKNFQRFKKLDLFNRFDYEDYKYSWNAGFQTKNLWPEKDFSYNIAFSQREDIGDIRTNWELNRHYQFALLAKNFYVTSEIKYLTELEDLFYDWNRHNLFLHGVEWTSPMEVAIRLNSWVYTLLFLQETKKDISILKDIEQGIIVMADYIVKHRAKYSSANNHLIVEMYGVALAGILSDYSPWIELSINILDKEIIKQNYEDGVNKEMSLHYQCFVMESYSLLILLMKNNRISVPNTWYRYLEKMARFVKDSSGEYGEVAVFGDSDEGKILDLYGGQYNYYHYILQLMSIIFEKKYTDLSNINETVNWIFDQKHIDSVQEKNIYESNKVVSYKEGGYTFLRSNDKRILIAIDHAKLGFGSIAAHGHADALSIQVFVDGKALFVDTGSYNYHIPAIVRDRDRSTIAHNTVIVDGNQSEILGPFMWGDRAETHLDNLVINNNEVILDLETGYRDIKHYRRIYFDYKSKLIIKDKVSSNSKKCSQIWNIDGNWILSESEKYIKISNGISVRIKSNGKANIDKDLEYSPKYNNVNKLNRLLFDFNDCITTEMIFN